MTTADLSVELSKKAEEVIKNPTDAGIRDVVFPIKQLLGQWKATMNDALVYLCTITGKKYEIDNKRDYMVYGVKKFEADEVEYVEGPDTYECVKFSVSLNYDSAFNSACFGTNTQNLSQFIIELSMSYLLLKAVWDKQLKPVLKKWLKEGNTSEFIHLDKFTPTIAKPTGKKVAMEYYYCRTRPTDNYKSNRVWYLRKKAE